MDWWFCTEQVPKRFCPEGVPSKAQMGGKHLKTYCGINHTAFIPYGTYVILAYPGMNWWSSRCLVMAVMMVIKTMWLSLSVSLEIVHGASFYPESGSRSLSFHCHSFGSKRILCDPVPSENKKPLDWNHPYPNPATTSPKCQMQSVAAAAADMTVDQTSMSKTSREFMADRNLQPVWSPLKTSPPKNFSCSSGSWVKFDELSSKR